MNLPRTVDVLGLKYSVTDYKAATDLVLKAAHEKRHFSLYALPVHGVIERRRDNEFAQACDSATMIVPDGQPIRWMMNWLHDANLADRVYGPTLLRHVLLGPHTEEFRVYVYGGRTPAVQQAFIDHIETTYTNVRVCGRYREDSADVQTLTAAMVNATQPNLVLVGLGCPKQEKWIAQQQHDISAALMGVGAAFSFFSGDQKTAPGWMQDFGLEWLFRLGQEPRRLWQRYLYTNSLFVLLAIGALAKHTLGLKK
ncbi:UDP-N-acetyl-D-mannosaminuronic acid transferase [Arenicella chitinivorans]|uniref:UDP-N-acetyl-D-mannosaminuronic acid transferase n=1 Tax=Arenicella chitinivorans TaxID=1329800 RepID=A0A918VLM2_9GAMM|nr:WecB/TagA/CpsF family glycosyltransferase [Arenicella chitinivorans]GHA06001.1 UDP-N-acetyl-D-mannosaminuronic acid transferase [Arenicella chitinivorans]